MYVERQSLIAGDKLALNSEYKIIEEIGKGTSSIVYLAEDCSNSRLVLIKELYPKNLGIFRNTDNSLVIPSSSNDNFEIYKSYLREAVKLQIEFHNSDELANSTSDAERIIGYNNTLYVLMGRVVGKSYDKVTPESLNSVLKICKSLTKAISFYHLKGYLHLDIKAENVFKIKETDELVKLFDFDSVHKKEDIINKNCKPTYSKSCAAPEVKKIEHGKYDEIDERSDIYSIGAMLFKKVMDRDVDTEDSRPKKRWDFTNIELLKTESPQAKSALTEIFRNTLARNKEYRYKSTDELIEALDKAIEITSPSNKIFLCDHNITTTTSKDYYISRADKVREIREKLENYHIAYLYGIGGIGKSETAREYAETYRNDYEVIHFTHYSIGLKETLSSLNFINLDDKDFKLEERYNVRLNMLSKKGMYNSNTLLIIDNYNVAPDSDEYKNNVEVMKDLKKLDIHILFTTRTSPDDNNRKIDIKELSGDNLKQLFFAVNPKGSNSEERIKQVDELIETAFRHTLTVDLVAHQTVQIERYGKKTLADYITVLKNSGLNNEVKLSVYNNKDDNEKNDIVYEHIKALFNFSFLTDKERYVMVNACLLPVSGMETAEFCEFIDLANYGGGVSASDWGEDNTITNLVNSGWIKRVGENKERIALHPTISNVTVNELKPELVEFKCLSFFNNLYLYLKHIKCIENNYNICNLFNYLDELCISIISKVNLSYNNEIVINIIDSIITIMPSMRISKKSNYICKTAIKKIAEVKIKNESPIKMFNSKIIILLFKFKLLELGDIYLDTVKTKCEIEHPLSADDYIELAVFFGFFNIEKRTKYMKLALEEYILNKPEYSLELANYYSNCNAHCLSSIYRYLGNYEKSLYYTLKSLEIREKLAPTDYDLLLPAIYRVAYAYKDMNNIKKCNQYLVRAVHIKEKEGFSKLDLADEYWSLSHINTVNSINFLYKSWHYIKLFKNSITRDNYKYFRRIYTQITTSFAIRKYYNEALECAIDNFNTCHLYFENDKYQFYISYNDIAKYNKEIGNNKKAIYYYKLSVNALEEYGDPYLLLSKQYAKLGHMYVPIEDYYNAIKYFKRAINLFDNRNPAKELCHYYFCVAQIYEKINDPINALLNYKHSYKLNENQLHKEAYESIIKRLSENTI